jgi:hypothetical protein
MPSDPPAGSGAEEEGARLCRCGCPWPCPCVESAPAPVPEEDDLCCSAAYPPAEDPRDPCCTVRGDSFDLETVLEQTKDRWVASWWMEG